jgi:hypothetical protein
MIRECAKELDISSGAEATDIGRAPQIEKPAAIEEKADQAKAVIKPFRMRRKWIPAAAAGALAFLLFGVFFIRSPEKNQAQAPATIENQSIEIRQPIHADPKDLSPSIIIRVPDSRKSQKPPDKSSEKSTAEGSETGQKQNAASVTPIELTLPQRTEPLEKPPLEDLFGKLPPEQPTGINQAVAEKKTASSAEHASKSLESKERRFLLFFKPGSVELEDGSYEILRQVSDLLSANPNSEVTLTFQSTQDDRPGLGPKLLELRATSIRSVLTAKPKFKGKITAIDSYVQGAAEDQESAGSRFSKPWAEIRVEPGAKSQVID